MIDDHPMRARRDDLKKTIGNVSEQSGCDPASISRYERGIEVPRITAVPGLCRAYEAEVETVVSWFVQAPRRCAL